MSNYVITLPRLHEAQQQIADDPHRFKVVCCGRRFGKSTLGIDSLKANLDKPQGWFSPTYKMLLEVWREVENIYRPLIVRRSIQERRLELLTGGVIEFWSMDKPDVARGRKYAHIVVDESAQVSRLLDSFHEVLRPTLADYEGTALFLSTPRGRNGFYSMYVMGQDDERTNWASWRYHTKDNPHIPIGEVESMRESMPSVTFQQEVEAVFVQSQGAVFSNLDAVMSAKPSTPDDHKGHMIVIGADWGKENDYTVFSVGCIDCAREVLLHRSNRQDYMIQAKRLQGICEAWGRPLVKSESNAMGTAVNEMLIALAVRVDPFATTAQTKPPLIQNLALALERGEFAFIDDPIARAELEAFEEKVDPLTNRRKYSAPSGMHDDTVIARALMYRAVTDGSTSMLLW